MLEISYLGGLGLGYLRQYKLKQTVLEHFRSHQSQPNLNPNPNVFVF